MRQANWRLIYAILQSQRDEMTNKSKSQFVTGFNSYHGQFVTRDKMVVWRVGCEVYDYNNDE